MVGGGGCEVTFPDMPRLGGGHWPYGPGAQVEFPCVPMMFPL